MRALFFPVPHFLTAMSEIRSMKIFHLLKIKLRNFNSIYYKYKISVYCKNSNIECVIIKELKEN